MDGTKNLSAVKVNGLDFDRGLELYEGSESVYLEVLRAFFVQGRRQIDAMRTALDGGDMHRYGIEAHALKTASRGLGALELSTIAAAQEAAGKRNNVDAVHEGSGAMLEAYSTLLEAIEASGLVREEDAPADHACVEPGLLKERLVCAAERAENYDLPAMENILRELLRHPLESSLADEIRGVLELSGRFMYEETEAALKKIAERSR